MQHSAHIRRSGSISKCGEGVPAELIEILKNAAFVQTQALVVDQRHSRLRAQAAVADAALLQRHRLHAFALGAPVLATALSRALRQNGP